MMTWDFGNVYIKSLTFTPDLRSYMFPHLNIFFLFALFTWQQDLVGLII